MIICSSLVKMEKKKTLTTYLLYCFSGWVYLSYLMSGGGGDELLPLRLLGARGAFQQTKMFLNLFSNRACDSHGWVPYEQKRKCFSIFCLIVYVFVRDRYRTRRQKYFSIFSLILHAILRRRFRTSRNKFLDLFKPTWSADLVSPADIVIAAAWAPRRH